MGSIFSKGVKILVAGIILLVFTVRYTPSPKALSGKYEEDQILVKFKPSISPAVTSSVHSRVNARVIRSFRVVQGLQYVKLPEGLTVKKALEVYSQDPNVEYAEPSFIVRKMAIPNDTLFPSLWGMRNTGQVINGVAGTPDADIDAPEAWDLHKGSRNVVVAVIDSGVDYLHRDLAKNMWRNPREIPSNGLDDDGNRVSDDIYGINVTGIDPGGLGCGSTSAVGDPMDNDGHGTHVAGIIGGVGNNSRGVVGVNWNVAIMAAKFLDASGSGSTAGALLALEYVLFMKTDRGIPIIATNNSWGGGGYSRALYEAIQAHRAAGILFIAAAGNANANNDVVEDYPANFNLDNIISVAATTNRDTRAVFSNFGKRSVHVGAPGLDVLSTCSASLLNCVPPATPESPFAFFSGTSMATPHVTGLAALLKAQNGTRDWRAIKKLILAGGDVKPSLANTVTRKRINARDSLSCSGKTSFGVVFPRESGDLSRDPFGFRLRFPVNFPIPLKALNINCAASAGPVTVTRVGSTQTTTLSDGGIFPDQAANDGVYSGSLAIATAGNRILRFSAAGQTPIDVPVTVFPLRIYSLSTPPFSATSIAATGIPVTALDNSDEASTLVTLPFPFTFYGVIFTSVRISTNGGVSFISGTLPYSNESLPTRSLIDVAAPFWDDLIMRTSSVAGSRIFTQTFGTAPNRRFVIQWNKAFSAPNPTIAGDGVTFQIELFESTKKVRFNFFDVFFGNAELDKGVSATVGIQNLPISTQVSFNTASLANNSSKEFTPVNLAALPVKYLDPTGVNFFRQRVGSGSVVRFLNINNVGNVNLVVSSLTRTGSTAFSLVSPPPLPQTVLPGRALRVGVRFTPGTTGVHGGSINVNTNDPTVRSGAITLTGVGVSEPDINVSPTQHNFGNVPVSAPPAIKALVIVNTSNSPLVVDSIDFRPPFSVSGTFPVSIAPGSSIARTMSFDPTTVGSFFQDLIIYSNDPDESAVSVRVTGNGT